MADLVYLDHLATTPIDPRVLGLMRPWLEARYGHPASRSHAFGWEAEEGIETARARVADLVRADPKEIVFTSGGTEADNLALKGVAEAHEARGRHVVTTQVEGRPVLDTCAWLEKRRGFEVTRVAPDAEGRVAVAAIEAALRPDTLLVSVQAANGEVGTLQPIREIGALCAARGVWFHVDAVAAAAWLDLDVRREGIHLLSLSANKMGGPKGAGALYVRRKDPRVRLAPIQHGGAHERGLRAGTVDVPAVVGFGAAAELVRTERSADAPRVEALRDRLEAELLARVTGATVHGARGGRLPCVSNLSFEGVEAESLLMGMPDVALSSGAGCTSATQEPSHVLRAMGVPDGRIHGSVRVSLGRPTSPADVARATERIVAAVTRIRGLGKP